MCTQRSCQSRWAPPPGPRVPVARAPRRVSITVSSAWEDRALPNPAGRTFSRAGMACIWMAVGFRYGLLASACCRNGRSLNLRVRAAPHDGTEEGRGAGGCVGGVLQQSARGVEMTPHDGTEEGRGAGGCAKSVGGVLRLKRAWRGDDTARRHGRGEGGRAFCTPRGEQRSQQHPRVDPLDQTMLSRATGLAPAYSLLPCARVLCVRTGSAGCRSR